MVEYQGMHGHWSVQSNAVNASPFQDVGLVPWPWPLAGKLDRSSTWITCLEGSPSIPTTTNHEVAPPPILSSSPWYLVDLENGPEPSVTIQ